MSSLYFREDFGRKPKWTVWELDQTMQNPNWREHQSIRVVWEDWYSLRLGAILQDDSVIRFCFFILAWPRVPSTLSGERQKKSCQLPACFNIPSHKSADGNLKLRGTVRHIELMRMNLAGNGSCTWRTLGSQHGLFPPPLRGLPRRFLRLALLLTLRHGRHSLLQPPHLLPILPADLPVWTQGSAARVVVKAVEMQFSTFHIYRWTVEPLSGSVSVRDMIDCVCDIEEKQEASTCEPVWVERSALRCPSCWGCCQTEPCSASRGLKPVSSSALVP